MACRCEHSKNVRDVMSRSNSKTVLFEEQDNLSCYDLPERNVKRNQNIIPVIFRNLHLNNFLILF